MEVKIEIISPELCFNLKILGVFSFCCDAIKTFLKPLCPEITKFKTSLRL